MDCSCFPWPSSRSFTRKYRRARWHPSFPPKHLSVEGSPEQVAGWLRDNLPSLPRAGPERSARERQLASMSAAEYVACRRAGGVTCREYAEVLVRRMEHYRDMNQFMYWDILPRQGDKILQQADALDKLAAAKGVEAIAPLYGLPVPCKGTIATVDFPSSAGSGLLHGCYAKRDADVVTLLRSAHAVVMGKTNVPEFAIAKGWVTANYANGVTRNPYASDLTAGGSSGGSGSAVATYIAPVAITEDTAGSTRNPAFQCHNFGFDPCRNHFPNLGNPGMSYTHDQIGLNARSLDDILLMDAALLGTQHEHAEHHAQCPPASSVRVGAPRYPLVEYVPLEGGAEGLPPLRVSRELERKLEAVKGCLRLAGVQVLEEEWPEVESATLGRRVNAVAEILFGREANGKMQNLAAAESVLHSYSGQMQTWVARYLEAPVSNVDLVEDMMPMGLACDSGWFHRQPEGAEDESNFRFFLSLQPELARVWNSYFDAHGVDVLLTPPQFANAVTFAEAVSATMPVMMDVGQGWAEIPNDVFVGIGFNYLFFKSTGIPKLVVPTGLDERGRPTAVELWGRAVPPEKMFDDEFARTFDLKFLYSVKPLVEVIHRSHGLARVDAPIVSDLWDAPCP